MPHFSKRQILATISALFMMGAAAPATSAAHHPRASLISAAPAAALAENCSSVVDRLTTDKSAVEITCVPPGTGKLHVAWMKNLAAEGIGYGDVPVGQIIIKPKTGQPVIDVLAETSAGAAIGNWAGRLQTSSEPPKEEPPKEEPKGTSVTDRLTSNHSAVEITSEPAGTGKLHVAWMKNLQAEGVTYGDVAASQLVIQPKAGLPVIDVLAETSTGAAIGGWAGRLQTSPEPPKEETPAEKEQHEREAREKAEREKAEKERIEREEREKAEGASMFTAVDSGGWIGESIATDLAGAVKYIRSTGYTYRDDTKMGYLAKAGIHLMPLFEDRGNGHYESPETIANEEYNWFVKYGHGGTFWAGKTDLGPTTAEIVNEPGNPYFWGSNARTNQAGYDAIIKKVREVNQKLPAANRPVLLISMDGGFEGDAYGKQLLKVDPNLTGPEIGWTVHPYGGTGNREQSAQGGRTRVLESFRPLYITEVGWPTAVGQPPTGDSLQWTEQEQANNITNFIRWARGLGYVRDVTIFNYRDYGTKEWYGIESSSGRHKISYTAIKGA